MGGEGAAWERRWHGAMGAARVRGNKCAGQQNCGEGAGLRDWRMLDGEGGREGERGRKGEMLKLVDRRAAHSPRLSMPAGLLTPLPSPRMRLQAPVLPVPRDWCVLPEHNLSASTLHPPSPEAHESRQPATQPCPGHTPDQHFFSAPAPRTATLGRAWSQLPTGPCPGVQAGGTATPCPHNLAALLRAGALAAPSPRCGVGRGRPAPTEQ